MLVRAAVLASAVAAAAYRRKTLTIDGAGAAALVGTVVFARGGVRAATTLLAFFVSSSALSRLRERRATDATLGAKGGQRDLVQVLANGGAPTVALLFGRDLGFVCGLAAAAADTWATEVGLLAGQRPRLITTWRPVEAGLSGGVTIPGLLASAAGACVIGATWWLTGGSVRAIRPALVAGVFGSVIDSLLGATVQARYRCEACERFSETKTHSGCPASAELVHGWPVVTNDAVNAMSITWATALGSWLTRRQSCAS
ncbi:MAG TPA: DUF92 domain-containing protein [Chloroflexota bacterium]|jgi:uncharacterized protein (TIGR00297 family)|nr:DUF92 domain-containing protein [Chloroflexota bacterium]